MDAGKWDFLAEDHSAGKETMIYGMYNKNIDKGDLSAVRLRGYSQLVSLMNSFVPDAASTMDGWRYGVIEGRAPTYVPVF
ncbi:hypothetical protein ACA910_002302 [Epithemia clementina (nom. ined.)]